MVDLEVNFCGLVFKNPILAGSSELTETTDNIKKVIRAGVGGIVGKTITTITGLYRPRPYLFHLSKHGFRDGAMASVGGCDLTPPKKWIRKQGLESVKLCRKAEIPFIASIMGQGSNIHDWIKLAKMVEGIGVDAMELNFGGDVERKSLVGPITINPKISYEITKAVKGSTSVPIIPKLNHSRVVSRVAQKCEKAGADGLTAFNSIGFGGIIINVEKEEAFGLPTNSFYGPGRGIRPMSLSLIAEILRTVKIPVSGVGGIWGWKDALEYLMLGCSTVQIVSAILRKGYGFYSDIIKGVSTFMARKGYNELGDIRGKILDSIVPVNKILTNEEWAELKTMSPIINKAKCNFCGTCQEVCIHGAIKVNKNRKKKSLTINKDLCKRCGMCISICPSQAIRLEDIDGNVIWTGEGSVHLELLKSMY